MEKFDVTFDSLSFEDGFRTFIASGVSGVLSYDGGSYSVSAAGNNYSLGKGKLTAVDSVFKLQATNGKATFEASKDSDAKRLTELSSKETDSDGNDFDSIVKNFFDTVNNIGRDSEDSAVRSFSEIFHGAENKAKEKGGEAESMFKDFGKNISNFMSDIIANAPSLDEVKDAAQDFGKRAKGAYDEFQGNGDKGCQSGKCSDDNEGTSFPKAIKGTSLHQVIVLIDKDDEISVTIEAFYDVNTFINAINNIDKLDSLRLINISGNYFTFVINNKHAICVVFNSQGDVAKFKKLLKQ